MVMFKKLCFVQNNQNHKCAITIRLLPHHVESTPSRLIWQLSNVGLGQYLDRRRPGNPWCRKYFFWFFLFRQQNFWLGRRTYTGSPYKFRAQAVPKCVLSYNCNQIKTHHISGFPRQSHIQVLLTWPNMLDLPDRRHGVLSTSCCHK